MLEERKEPHTVDSYIQKSETCADGRRPTLIEIEHAWILEYKSILMMMMMAASENNQIFFPTRLLLLLLFHSAFQLKKGNGAIDDFSRFFNYISLLK